MLSAREIARKTKRAVVTLRNMPVAPPGHYYSPLTTAADAERAIAAAESTEVPTAVPIDLEALAAFALELAPMWTDLRTAPPARYRRDMMYEQIDAAVYHSMLRRFGPARVLEVGSGYSTAVALDTIEAHGLVTQVECVEPNPERLRSLLRPGDDVKLRQSLVQDVPIEIFEQLNANDFLFIDSTHVAKAGSDVVWTTLRILPRLQPGVIVHIHDMFWPLEYQDRWLRGRRDWNEIYLIHAYLAENPHWRILFFNDQALLANPQLRSTYFPHLPDQRPGGLWLQRV